MTNNFAIERDPNYVLLDVCGQVDSASADTFRAALSACKASDLPYFIVDLSSCRYIDSSGLGMLLAHHRDHKHFIVIVPTDNPRNPLTSTSLANNFNFVQSRDVALAMTQGLVHAPQL